MKVKIVKCSHGGSWYQNKIGKTFDVLETKQQAGNNWYVLRKHGWIQNLAPEYDCEIITN